MTPDEPYLMPSHVRLLVSDTARATAFYESLGFHCVNRDSVFVHLRWARYADVFLVGMPSGVELPGQRGLGVILCFYASEEVSLDDLRARAEASGAAVDGPRNQPWFTRELVVTDPEGYKIAFVAPSERVEA
ncbi:VOC family protein [Polyangium sp. y55x31]|uniref:VOC family protein n=1 Tax=Polyangium sp. y55x31 TaxID=3042688 RepID=UPI0024831837|nr:VOC family protein [Polyangium sp. y55x31]MDI1477649.1 VOC family protein [Polyangium sp. y55x31]